VVARLNDDQRRAVEHVGGRLLVTAGAGSGKTRTLAERFARAVDSHGPETGCDVNRLLTITYTEKAAGELAERVRAALRNRDLGNEARKVDGAWISTIHAFCAKVLRREALIAGIDPAFRVADEVAVAALGVKTFDEVVSARLDRGDEGSERLFEEYGYEEVRAAAASLSRTLRARGIGAPHVALEAVRSIEDLVAEAEALFAEAGECFAAYCGRATTPAAQQAACHGVLERLDRMRTSHGDEISRARAVWSAIVEFDAALRPTKETAEAVERLKDGRAALAAQCSAIVAHADAKALLNLSNEYMERFQAAKKELSVLDYEDLIIETERLFVRHPDVLERYQAWFKLVMVDEFQDTDELQLALIERIAGANLATVGDVKQSIYAFRGADVEVYRRHRESMANANAERVVLSDNYRSHEDLIRFVNRVFSQDELFGPEEEGLRAARTDPAPVRIASGSPRVEICVVDTRDGGTVRETCAVEARVVAQRFSELRDAGFAPSEMVVLLRAYADAPTFADALEQVGFVTSVVGGNRFFELREVGAMRALCRVIANPHDDEALAQLLVSDLLEGGTRLLARCAAIAHESQQRRSLWDRLSRVAKSTDQDSERAAVIVRIVERARDAAPVTGLAQALASAGEGLGIDAYLDALGAQGRIIRANITQFYRKAAAFEAAGGMGAAGLAASLDAEQAVGVRHGGVTCVGGAETVTIMSVHAAKGLEFPVVAVPTLSKKTVRTARGFWLLRVKDGLARLSVRPSMERVSSQDRKLTTPPLFAELAKTDAVSQREEAIRVFYVACTRAKEVLVLTGSAPVEEGLGGADTPLAWALSAYGRCLIDPVLSMDSGSSVTVNAEGIPVRIEKRDGACGEEPHNGGSQPPSVVTVAIPSTVATVVPGARETPRLSRPRRISYTDLALHQRCSLRYWAERVAGMGRAAASSPASARASGSAMHVLLQQAFVTGELPDAARVTAVARGLRLSDSEARALRETTETFLRTRYGRELLARRRQAKTEMPFGVVLGGEGGPLLVGAIDVCFLGGGGAELVDYKSGRGSFEKDRSRSPGEAYELQAKCYALAALMGGAETATVRFVYPEVLGGDREPRQLLYRYESRDAKRIESSLLAQWEAMADKPYRATSRWCPEPCSGCPASGSVCELTDPRLGAV